MTTPREPTFDADGYPTEETLEAIRQWSWYDGFGKLLAFCHRAWHWPERVQRRKLTEKDPHSDMDAGATQWYFSTGGWSGNESLVSAMKQNFIFWSTCWWQSRCGGAYWFRVKELGK